MNTKGFRADYRRALKRSQRKVVRALRTRERAWRGPDGMAWGSRSYRRMQRAVELESQMRDAAYRNLDAGWFIIGGDW